MAKPKPPEPRVQLNLSVPMSIRERLQAYAQATGSSLNAAGTALLIFALREKNS